MTITAWRKEHRRKIDGRPLVPVHGYVTTRNVYSAFHQLHASRFCIIYQGDKAHDPRGISAWRLDSRTCPIGFWSFVSLNGSDGVVILCFFLLLLFLSSVYGRIFEIVVERLEIFLWQDYSNFFSSSSEDLLWKNLNLCSFVCVGNEFFFFFFFLYSQRRWKELHRDLWNFSFLFLNNGINIIPCSLSSEREIYMYIFFLFSLDNRYRWIIFIKFSKNDITIDNFSFSFWSVYERNIFLSE